MESKELSIKSNNHELLHKISDSFLMNIPFRCFSNDICNFIASNQDLVLGHTIFHELNKNMNVKKAYQQSFIKKIIEELENQGVEVIESMYETYVNLHKIISTEDETHFFHYRIGNSYISIKQCSNMISSGTTGLSVWQAGVVLSQYCVNNKSLLHKKRILELGCGLGLTGLSVIHECIPSQYCFSDNHDRVLQYLIDNIYLNLKQIARNFDNMSSELVFEGNFDSTRIFVLQNEWEKTTSSDFCKLMSPEIILAADVVYDPSTFASLAQTLQYFLDLNKKTVIILSCTVRCVSTLDQFLKCLHNLNLQEKLLHTTDTWNSSYSSKCEVKIFSIQAVEGK